MPMMPMGGPMVPQMPAMQQPPPSGIQPDNIPTPASLTEPEDSAKDTTGEKQKKKKKIKVLKNSFLYKYLKNFNMVK